MESVEPETLELWNLGTLEPWNPGTMAGEQPSFPPALFIYRYIAISAIAISDRAERSAAKYQFKK
jgi:hypothetical protein